MADNGNTTFTKLVVPAEKIAKEAKTFPLLDLRAGQASGRTDGRARWRTDGRAGGRAGPRESGAGGRKD